MKLQSLQVGMQVMGTSLAACALAFAAPLSAQMEELNSAALIARQRAALDQFAWMDGVWRGTVTSASPEGTIELVQTERVGTMAGGTMRVIEGRGYGADGTLEFNAAATITYDAVAGQFIMNSTARGMTARPWFRTTADGFEWGMESGPVSISYIARYKDGEWIEEGFMAFPGQTKRQFMTMRLQRVGDTDWPGAGAVGPE